MLSQLIYFSIESCRRSLKKIHQQGLNALLFRQLKKLMYCKLKKSKLLRLVSLLNSLKIASKFLIHELKYVLRLQYRSILQINEPIHIQIPHLSNFLKLSQLPLKLVEKQNHRLPSKLMKQWETNLHTPQLTNISRGTTRMTSLIIACTMVSNQARRLGGILDILDLGNMSIYFSRQQQHCPLPIT